MKKFMFLFPFLWLMACEPQQQISEPSLTKALAIIQPQGKNLQTRFLPPQGFFRKKEQSKMYTNFLRNIPLKPHGTAVYLFNGTRKVNQVHAAVLTFDTGNKDLQQCADAVMRIRAEYLFLEKKYDQLHFNFTNGFKADFIPWMQGKRLQLSGNRFTWVQKSKPDSSHAALRSYLEYVYQFAGSLSLSKELKPISPISSIQPGDVWIIGGTPGHAVTVMDVVENSKGEKRFLLSQGYMPAQDIHILINENTEDNSPWYSINDIQDKLYTPEYTFYKDNLMRFAD